MEGGASRPGGGAEGGRATQLPPIPPALASAVRGTGGRPREKEGTEGSQQVRAGPRGHRPLIRPPLVPLTLRRGARVWTQALLRRCPQATPARPGRGRRAGLSRVNPGPRRSRGRAGARGPRPHCPGRGLLARRWPPRPPLLRPQPGARDAGLDRLSSGHFGLSFREEGFILGLWWSYFSSFAGKRGRGCRWTVAGGLRGEGVFTPGAGRRRRRFRSHLEAGGRSSEKRELLAPSLRQGGHAGPPRSPPRACPGLALRSPTFGLPRTRLCRPPPRGPQAIYYLKQLSSITREPAGPRRETPQETGTSFFFLALPRTAPTAATSSSPVCPAARSKVGPGLQLVAPWPSRTCETSLVTSTIKRRMWSPHKG